MLRRLIPFALLTAIVYYLWRRLVRDTGLSGWKRIAATAAILGLALPMHLAIVFAPSLPPQVHGAAAWPMMIGWALIGLTFIALVTIDVGRLLVWLARRVARRQVPVDLDRRRLLARVTGGVAASLVITEVGAGMAKALGGPTVVDVPIALRRWPRALDGLTICQLTDLHAGMTIGRDYVADVVARINAIHADLIVVTGDMVDGSVADLASVVAPLAALRAPLGVFSVTGNHEYYSGADAWIAHFADLGITTLRNQRVAIERAGASFDLVGIDDHGAARWPGHGPDLARALVDRDPARAVVLLAHQPRQVHDAARHGVDLQISGHTHGGQLWPWHYVAAAQQGGLLAGRYRVGDTELFVGRGAGYWGPPVRFGAPAELPRIILRASACAD